jgi:hypothetical protein
MFITRCARPPSSTPNSFSFLGLAIAIWGDLWRSGLAPVSAAGNECAAGSQWFEPQSRQEIFRLV